MAAECEWRGSHPGIPATQVSVEELCTQPDGTLCRLYLSWGSLLRGFELSECCSGDYSQAAILQPGGIPRWLPHLLPHLCHDCRSVTSARCCWNRRHPTGDTQPPFSSSYTWIGSRKSVMGGSLASGTQFSILQHPSLH